jgi:hypothetical protein
LLNVHPAMSGNNKNGNILFILLSAELVVIPIPIILTKSKGCRIPILQDTGSTHAAARGRHYTAGYMGSPTAYS